MTSTGTVVVGAGQAGLSAGYWLAQRGLPFLIVDAASEIGDVWASRWDGLRLFSPHGYNDLPGMPFPRSTPRFPGKDHVAAYLRAYQAHFDLPVRLNTTVRSLTRADDRYLLQTGSDTLEAEHVIVATGPFHRPVLPAFAEQLDPSIWQTHSSRYKTPGQLPPGPTLVVGTGNSGAQIAMELAATRETWLSGESTGYAPRTFLGVDIYTWLRYTGLLTSEHVTWQAGATPKSATGDPRLGITPADLDAKGIRRVPRTVAVDGTQIVLANDRRLDVASVVWATGFRPDFSWLQRPILNDDGVPHHTRGIVDGEPGLYVLGLRFLTRLNSSLLNGVGADAEYLTTVIAARTAGAPDPPLPDAPHLAPLRAAWRRFWVRRLLAQTPLDAAGFWKAP